MTNIAAARMDFMHLHVGKKMLLEKAKAAAASKSKSSSSRKHPHSRRPPNPLG
jgi:hypothetical protein